jgi:hypothetical protein
VRPHIWIVALGLWIAGLLIGSWAERDPQSEPMFANGYRVIAADLHVHAYPGDGVLPPWEIAREARRQRLDAVALTNHNQMLPVRLAALVPFASPALLIPGEEVTTPGYHMAAIGLRYPIDWHHSAAEAASEIHAQGGAAIAAHPGRIAWPAFDRPALVAIDGAEAAHPGMDFKGNNREDYAAFFERARSVKPTIAAIGSTDFHDLAPLGQCRTYLFVRDLTVPDIVDAVRAGRTVACDAHGRTYGNPSLARIVAARCERDALSDPTSVADRAGVVCAFGGLVLLIVAGGRRM